MDRKEQRSRAFEHRVRSVDSYGVVERREDHGGDCTVTVHIADRRDDVPTTKVGLSD